MRGATRCGTCGGPTSSTAAAAPPRPLSPAPVAADGARSASPTDPGPRVQSGRNGTAAWRWGGSLNEVAVLLFLVLAAVLVIHPRLPARRSGYATVSRLGCEATRSVSAPTTPVL